MRASAKPRSTRPQAPAGLSLPARGLWLRLRDEYGIVDAGGLAVLEQAARCYDRAEEARRMLDREGVVTKDRWGQRKPHPAATVERDARAQLLAALRQLNIATPEEA